MKAYSYRDDADLSAFNDTHPVVIFDGVCTFCSRSMRLVFKHEKQPLYFIPTQSELGRNFLKHYDLDPDDPASFIFLKNGEPKFSSTGVFALFSHVKGWPALLRFFWIIPRPITDFAYGIFARNRYKWFGKSDTCIIPTDEMKSRILDFPNEELGGLA